MKPIMIPADIKKDIARDFRVTVQMVNKALRGDSHSPLAISLRKVAIERGGCEYNGIRNTNNTDHE